MHKRRLSQVVGVAALAALCLLLAVPLIACSEVLSGSPQAALSADGSTASTPETAASEHARLPKAAAKPPLKKKTPAKKSKAGPKPRIKLLAARITRVVDGDTAWVTINKSGAGEKVRFIGVDTPENTIEVEPYGAQASAYAKTHLSNKTVYLETDAEKRDRYGRLLAYIWMSKPVVGTSTGRPTFAEAKKRMFNAWLARDGYAQTMTIPPNVKYEDYFLRLQRTARAKDRGLWNPKVIAQVSRSKPEKGVFIANRSSGKFHRSTCRWAAAMSESNKVRYSSRKAAIKAGFVPCKVCRP